MTNPINDFSIRFFLETALRWPKKYNRFKHNQTLIHK